MKLAKLLGAFGSLEVSMLFLWLCTERFLVCAYFNITEESLSDYGTYILFHFLFFATECYLELYWF